MSYELFSVESCERTEDGRPMTGEQGPDSVHAHFRGPVSVRFLSSELLVLSCEIFDSHPQSL